MEQFNSKLPKGKKVTCLEDLGSLSVKELKNILESYHEKKTGVKADLILRVYGLFCRIKDQNTTALSFKESSTDNNSSDLWTYEAIYKTCCQNLPWTSDLRGTPPFNFIQLYDYLVIRTNKFKHILLKSTSYKKLKAFKFFYEGYIRKIDVARDNDSTFFDVRIKASMKKSLYKVIIKISNNSSDICLAACTCPAGIGLGGFGNCNHVGGLLFALEDFNRKGLQKCPEPVSCTSMLSAWNVPSSFNITNPAPIDEVVIQKIKFGKDNSKAQVAKYNLYDPRASFDRKLNQSSQDILTSKLSSSIPGSCYFGFHDRDPTTVPAREEELMTTEETGPLSLHCDNSDNEVVDIHDNSAFNDRYDISTSSFKEMMDIYCEQLTLTKDTIICIEKSTIGQNLNKDWLKHRQYRITASNFYSAAVNTVEPSSKLKSMFYSSTFSSASTHHGNKFEGHVRNLYYTELQQKGHIVHIDEVGLKVSYSCPYLGASLDGVVNYNNEVWGLEIKCPFSKFNSTLQDAVEDKQFFLEKVEEGVRLKRRHHYYYQVQGQMFCADLMRTDFVVWFGDDEPLFIETIIYDKAFMSKFVLPQLKYFYCRAVLPEFFTRRVQRGLKLYLQDGWQNYAKKNTKEKRQKK